MSGGGGGGPSSTTVTQSNIPDWLRPQVETVLGGAMREMFNVTEGEGGKLDITGVKPFVPYSSNPQDYSAGFTPMQEQVFRNTANLQVPGQFGAGTNMATQAGMGGIGAATQAGGLAAMQAGAGNQYMGMATNPYAMQAFMSPYMQNVVNVQQQQAQRQADINAQAEKARYTQAGVFGGGRQGLAQAQMNADLLRQKGDIQARGLQSAFDQAQKAQQFGADINLRGLTGAQQGIQNAIAGYDLLGRQGTNVANIGAQQLAAQKDILGMQSAAGAQQRQREQDIINQAIQTYGAQREHPFQQLSMLNSLVRGYAAPGQTVTQYQAAPNIASQAAGLGIGALGVSRLMGAGAAEGGVIKEPERMAAGGYVESPKRMATGGVPAVNRKVMFDPESVSLDQIKQGMKNKTLSDLIGIPAAMQKQEMSERAQAGLAGLPTNLPEEMATGGIVAFNGEEESLVQERKSKDPVPDFAEAVRAYRSALGEDDRRPTREMQEYLAAQRKAALSPEDISRQQGIRLLQAGLGIMGGRSQHALQNISEGAQPALKGYAEDLERQKTANLASLKAQADAAEAARAERRGEVKGAVDLFGKTLDAKTRMSLGRSSPIAWISAQNYLQAKRSQGDTRPDSVILDEGLEVYAKRAGFPMERIAATLQGVQSGATSTSASQDIDIARLRAETRKGAAESWSKLDLSDPIKEKYDDLAYGNKRKGIAPNPAAAEKFREEWIARETEARLPRIPSARPDPSRPPSGDRPARAAEPQQWQIDLLRSNKNDPSYTKAFDQKFGPGSSDKYIK